MQDVHMLYLPSDMSKRKKKGVHRRLAVNVEDLCWFAAYVMCNDCRQREKWQVQ
jgi:hypothetical protein